MAEEKKKRVRPTVAQVKQLQDALERQMESTKKNYISWKECEEKLRNQLIADKDLAKQVRDLKERNVTLEQSNILMESELAILRSKVTLLEEVADNRAAEVFRLQNRGFWRRLFNR